MEATTYRVLRARDLQAVSTLAGRALAGWDQEWGAQGLALRCLPACDLGAAPDGAPSWECWALPAGAAWVRRSAHFDRTLAARLFGADRSGATPEGRRDSAVASAVAGEAAGVLVRTLVQQLTGEEPGTAVTGAAGPGKLLRPGAGAVAVVIEGADLRLEMVLPCDAVPALPVPRCRPTGRPKTSLTKALGATATALTAEVGQAELSIGHLASLAVGDVVALGTTVDRPLTLRGPDQAIVCHGFLGTQDGARAVRVVV